MKIEVTNAEMEAVEKAMGWASQHGDLETVQTLHSIILKATEASE